MAPIQQTYNVGGVMLAQPFKSVGSATSALMFPIWNHLSTSTATF